MDTCGIQCVRVALPFFQPKMCSQAHVQPSIQHHPSILDKGFVWALYTRKRRRRHLCNHTSYSLKNACLFFGTLCFCCYIIRTLLLLHGKFVSYVSFFLVPTMHPSISWWHLVFVPCSLVNALNDVEIIRLRNAFADLERVLPLGAWRS